MQRLMLRSVYWTDMKADIKEGYNNCLECTDHMSRNDMPDPLPKEEASFPFKSISMDMEKLYYEKNFLIIVDIYSYYLQTSVDSRGKTPLFVNSMIYVRIIPQFV